MVAKRPQHKLYPGKWEFPGGKIDEGESPEACVCREIKEELGIEIEVEKPLFDWEYTYPDGKPFHFYSFLCVIKYGEIQRLAHDELRWVALGDLRKLDILEAGEWLIRESENSSVFN